MLSLLLVLASGLPAPGSPVQASPPRAHARSGVAPDVLPDDIPPSQRLMLARKGLLRAPRPGPLDRLTPSMAVVGIRTGMPLSDARGTLSAAYWTVSGDAGRVVGRRGSDVVTVVADSTLAHRVVSIETTSPGHRVNSSFLRLNGSALGKPTSLGGTAADAMEWSAGGSCRAGESCVRLWRGGGVFGLRVATLMRSSVPGLVTSTMRGGRITEGGNLPVRR